MLKFIKSIYDAYFLDIFEVNHFFAKEDGFKFREKPKEKNLLLSIISYFKRVYSNLKIKTPDEPKGKSDILFIAGTKNQKSALEPLQEDLKNISWEESHIAQIMIRKSWIFFVSILFLPKVIYNFFTAKGYHKNSIRMLFSDYLSLFGMYIYARYLFRKNRYKVVIIANDHSLWTRISVYAAKAENIKTVYFQHAQVTNIYPPLFTDYAFLDGVQALKTYSKISESDTKVFLTGCMKFDRFIRNSRKNQKKRVSISLNTIEMDLNLLDELVDKLIEKFPQFEISIRPHPAKLKDTIANEIAKKYDVTVSNAYEVNAVEYLQNQDILICGESSMHLEAAIFNVMPIYYCYDKTNEDYYGFYRDGLFDKVNYTADEVCTQIEDFIKSDTDIRLKAKPYNAVLGTPYEGKSTALSKKLVEEILSNGNPDLSKWQKVNEVTNIEGYSLK